MGILTTLEKNDLSKRLPPAPATTTPADTAEKNPVEKNPTEENPSPREPCPDCRGIFFWRDTYGIWRCKGCHYPASPAMIRQQVNVLELPLWAPGSETETPPANRIDGMIIMGIQEPDGRWSFIDSECRQDLLAIEKCFPFFVQDEMAAWR